MSRRRASAIRRGQDGQSNVIAERLRAARHLRTPHMTLEVASLRATRLSGYSVSRDALVRIENQQRSVYDFEVVALALALGVDVRFLLGLTDDPGPLELLPLPDEE